MSSAFHAALCVASRSSTVSRSAARCSRAALQYGQLGLTYMTTLIALRAEDNSPWRRTDQRQRTLPLWTIRSNLKNARVMLGIAANQSPACPTLERGQSDRRSRRRTLAADERNVAKAVARARRRVGWSVRAGRGTNARKSGADNGRTSLAVGVASGITIEGRRPQSALGSRPDAAREVVPDEVAK